MRHVAATKFCRGDKILFDLPPNVEVFTPGDLSLQPIAAMSAYDLSLDCTHKAMCCSNVLQACSDLSPRVFRPLVFCVMILRFRGGRVGPGFW